MLNRRRWIIALAVILLVIVVLVRSILWNETWLSPERISIHVVIDNRTNEAVGPFVITEDWGAMPLHVDQIEPFSKVDVYYKNSKSGGENAITITDNHGKVYSVVPYFENQQKGRVDIRIECVTSEGLSGKKRDLVSWYFSFEWQPWGPPACE